MSNESLNTSTTGFAVKMTLTAWQDQNKKLDKMLDELSEEQLHKETAPGRNTGIYLLGHLVAVNDAMIPLLGFGEKLFPTLEHIFIKSPDKSGQEMPSVELLKQNWETVNALLNERMDQMPAEDWFKKHSLVSEEDFAKEPHRNKLNIVISRTIHQSYHLGQLAYLVYSEI